MTTNHIDQLAQWWENAEEGIVQRGDHVIEYTPGDGAYRLFTAFVSEDEAYDEFRILARAPKPKPAWHDALAVLAGCKHDAPDRGRGTFINDRSGQWLDESGKRYVSDDLTDVTPLIKAEVTDEMVGRALDAADRHKAAAINTRIMREALTAALGLEAE